MVLAERVGADCSWSEESRDMTILLLKVLVSQFMPEPACL